MRRGQYVIVDGTEYAARVWGGGKVSLFIPQTGPKPDGWILGRESTWSRKIDASKVSEAFSISTRAYLDDVEVHVDSVNITDRTATVRAVQSTSRSDAGSPPPHPLLEALNDSPYSIDWVGRVPWDRLTDVYEASGRIDPTTGRDLPE